MAEELHPHNILIVTGSELRAERLDRPLAYHLQREISRRAGRDPRKQAFVVGDLWYLRHEEVHRQPTISLGGPGVNALSATFYRNLPVALLVEEVLLIQMDVSLKDLRVAVWGMDHESTKVALATFLQERFLGRYLRAAWSRREGEQ